MASSAGSLGRNCCTRSLICVGSSSSLSVSCCMQDCNDVRKSLTSPWIARTSLPILLNSAVWDATRLPIGTTVSLRNLFTSDCRSAICCSSAVQRWGDTPFRDSSLNRPCNWSRRDNTLTGPLAVMTGLCSRAYTRSSNLDKRRDCCRVSGSWSRATGAVDSGRVGVTTGECGTGASTEGAGTRGNDTPGAGVVDLTIGTCGTDNSTEGARTLGAGGVSGVDGDVPPSTNDSSSMNSYRAS